MVGTMSNLEYVDLEYGVRVGYQTKGVGLDGNHDFFIIQFPLHEAHYHDGASLPEWQETVWPYGGVPTKDPERLKDAIITSLFDMASADGSTFHNGMEDKYTIRGWQP